MNIGLGKGSFVFQGFERTSVHIKNMTEEFLCIFLVGIVLASSTQGNGKVGAIDRYNAAAGQFFQLKHDVATKNLGENVTLIWSRGANGSLDGTSSQVRIINGSLFFLPVDPSDSGIYTLKRSSGVAGASPVEKKMFLSVVRGACPQPSDFTSFQKGSTNSLLCGLEEIFTLDKSAEISWLKDCNPLNVHENIMRISNVNDKDEGNYTCLINFTFEGKNVSTSWTIQLRVMDDPPLLEPRVIHPQNETIKVKPGMKAELDCKVFMGVNKDMLEETFVFWLVNHSHIEKYNQLLKSINEDSVGKAGLYRLSRLVISEVRPEFFHVPFHCIVENPQSKDKGVAQLAPANDRDLRLHIFFCAAVPVVVAMVMIYRRFKVDVVLTIRRLRPLGFSERDVDGKLYDAYISSLHSEAPCSSQLGNFCLQVLPEVLEHRHGHKLFICGRDDLPGEAALDVIAEAVQKSRRLIIVVSAQNQSNLDTDDPTLQGLKLDPDRDEDQTDFEQQIGLYDALVENRLRVILVEMGKGVEYSLFPESIRYLKQKQGALRWRPSHGDPTAPPNHQFWKYLRYRMPHRPEGRPKSQFCL
ncbi:hypothetical protein SKAU_G00426310 [Synaphobranchus kaupii]|uniref:Uncharacterized protein n=1 Tax=Synaphobranchus kaupii TaxID=118154 RepID=A0A9Q1I8J7_SYNKA|nr:hypothetical protein SKAU_G00426310 [Synaphobranchus kaupii]